MRAVDLKPKMPKRKKNPEKKRFKKKVKKEVRNESVALMDDLGKSNTKIINTLGLTDKEHLLAIRHSLKTDELQPFRDKRRKKIIRNLGVVINLSMKKLHEKIKDDKITAKGLIGTIDKLGRIYVELLTKSTRREEEGGMIFPINPGTPLPDIGDMKKVLDIKRLPGNGESKSSK